MICCIQEFAEELTKVVATLSPVERREFVKPWLAYVAEKERARESDRRFLKSVGIDPDGD